jgi:hypothetical protein
MYSLPKTGGFVSIGGFAIGNDFFILFGVILISIGLFRFLRLWIQSKRYLE